MADDLIVPETLRAELVFAPGGVDAILNKLERDVRAVSTDISTKAGRAAISSLAHKVSRSKTALDDLGKQLVADWKARSTAVDADRRRVRERLDSLRDEVRQPLTDWEDAERRRVEGHEAALVQIAAMVNFTAAEPTAEVVSTRLSQLDALPPREWHEFAKRAADTTAQVRVSLLASHDAAVRREAERAELARLRAEAAEREHRERDERLQREAAQRAREAAEAEAREAARAQAAREAAERARVDRERLAAEEARRRAEQAAERAEQARVAAAEKAERDRVAAAEKARHDAEAAAAKAEHDRVAAVLAERTRVADEKRAQEAEAARREADKRHRAKVEGEALKALLELGVAPALGKTVVSAIAAGGVPHVRVVY